MRVRTVLLGIGVLLVVATATRLGFWQLERHRGKLEQVRALDAAAARTPLELADAPLPSVEPGRLVSVRGTYDPTRHFLLTGRLHDGEPGVEVVTPLRLNGDRGAILVHRGWLPADDAVHGRPQDHPEPGERQVVGFVEPLGTRPGSPMVASTVDSVTLFATGWLDADSVALRLPYPVRSLVLQERPDPDQPRLPRRLAPRRPDPSIHLGYAIQWFAVALIFAIGPVALARSRRARG